MRTPIRTPQQRDRRFARARRLTQSVFVGAGAMSAVLVGYAAANAKPVATTTVTAPTTITSSASTKSSSTSGATVPTKAPVTTTTVCTTTPSGTVTCY